MTGFADVVGPRLLAAKDRLKAKGWRCPSIEIGAKVLGDHGLVWWAVGYLDGSDSPLRIEDGMFTEDSPEQLLDRIDAAVAKAPTRSDKHAELESALAKLTPGEKELLGFRRLELERAMRRIED